jgi:mono/diheme cytochrome c family protein
MKNSSQSTIAAVYLSRFTAWLWSDGSFARIAKTITEGVSQPKQYRRPMPAMGRAQLTPDQVSAVAAYVWSLSHRAVRGSGNHADHP